MSQAAVIDHTAVEISPNFEKLPWGYEVMCEYQQQCDICQMLYNERSYLTPDRTMITERKPCKCMTAEIIRQRQEAQQKDARLKLQGRVDYYFGTYNMINDKEYNHMTFRQYKPENDSHRKAFKTLNGFKIGKDSCILHGLQGRGKTHLAVACARAQKSQGHIVLALKSVNLINRIKMTYQIDKDAESEILDILQNVDLLVIDDIGIEKPTDFVIEKLYTVIDYRVERHKSLICTTNIEGEDMVLRLNGALTSRIWGAGGAEMQLEIQGRDWRVT